MAAADHIRALLSGWPPVVFFRAIFITSNRILMFYSFTLTNKGEFKMNNKQKKGRNKLRFSYGLERGLSKNLAPLNKIHKI